MTDTPSREIVERWLEEVSGDASRSSLRDGSRLICHHPSGNSILRDARQSEIKRLFEPEGSAIRRRQYFFLSEDNYVAVLGAATAADVNKGTGHCWLQIFRLEHERVAETWFSGYAQDVDWGPLPVEPAQRSGAEDANKLVLRRWWEEMYSGHRFDTLMPELAGPEYIRHEPAGSWVTSIADHLNRVKGLYATASEKPRPRFQYQTLAEGDYVIGWGTMRGYRGGASRDDEVYSWVQLFRLEHGKLVETWFPGWLVGVDWGAMHDSESVAS